MMCKFAPRNAVGSWLSWNQVLAVCIYFPGWQNLQQIYQRTDHSSTKKDIKFVSLAPCLVDLATSLTPHVPSSPRIYGYG